MAVAIEVRDISKQFRLYNEKHTSLKERVIHGGQDAVHAVLGPA